MEKVIKRFNKQGKCIYYKNSDKNEIWFEYDDKGNCIYSKNSDGYEIEYEYIYEED